MANIILDVATSGTDPQLHSILEIALIKVDSSFNMIDKFAIKIRYANLVVSPEAVAHNGIDLRDSVNWTNDEAARDAVSRFLTGHSIQTLRDGQSVSRHSLVGLGVATDCQFLEAFLSTSVYRKVFFPRVSEIGTTVENCIAMGLIPYPRSPALLELALAAGVTIPEAGEHTAEADAQMALDVARSLFIKMREAGQRLRGEPVCASF